MVKVYWKWKNNKKRQIQEIEKEHTIRMAGHKAGSTAEIKAAAITRMQQRHASGGTSIAQPKRRGMMTTISIPT